VTHLDNCDINTINIYNIGHNESSDIDDMIVALAAEIGDKSDVSELVLAVADMIGEK